MTILSNGVKKLISEIGMENAPYDISNALYFLTDENTIRKRKFEAICVLRGRKYGPKKVLGF